MESRDSLARGRTAVGCNIVDPLDGEAVAYTREVYVRRIKDYARYGFSHLEFSHLLDIGIEDGIAIREACRMVGVAPWSVHSEVLNGGADVEAYFGIQAHCVEVAAALGASVVVCHLPCLEQRFDLGTSLKILGRMADMTAAHNLRLAIENCLYGDIDFIIRVIDALKRPDVGFNLDVGHAFLNQTKEIPAEIRKIGSRLITTHLHDNFGESDDHQMPGLGRIDWRGVLAAFLEIGYAGPLMMEMVDNSGKRCRSVEQLRSFELEKELIQGRAYLDVLWEQLRMSRRLAACASP